MQSNELTGRLPEEVCRLSKLEWLYVNENQLSGSIPECIGELSNLKRLFLDSNSWEGYVTERHFSNLTMLIEIVISSKSNLALNVSYNWVPPFQLQYIYMDSLKVGSKFPSWLLTQRQITDIMMKNTSISDTIPADWFASLLSQANGVHLSGNDINVELSLISAVPSGLGLLALSDNRFYGEFPSFLCNATSLGTLVISNNNFFGELPHCLGNLKELRYFDVMNNNFSGEIPVSLGSLINLTYLNLHKNKFQGKLPMSFQNLKELVTLDVGKNNLIDILPHWSGEQLPQLKYLILRSNSFFGEIPTQLCHYSSIQVLNLAKNKIRGSIPPCFGNFSAMITGDNNDLYPGFEPYYGEMILDDMKGYELNYTTTLGFSYSIDLSNNNISGEIPQELMDLRGLKNLNLAGNHLAGRIPDRIGKLESLEHLDLSRNKLYGHIPQSLSNLHFLSRLNLSFNNLSGRIPTGYQLQTLEDPSIYAGNNQLCGQPILKPCTDDPDSHNVHDYNEADSDSDDERMWFYAGIGPGLLVGFLGLCASLHFIKPWKNSYFHFVEIVFDKILIAFALLRRKSQN